MMEPAKTIIPAVLSYSKQDYISWVSELKNYFKSVHIDVIDSSYDKESWFDSFSAFKYLEDFNNIIVHLMVLDPFEFLFNKSSHLKKEGALYILKYSSLGDMVKDKLNRLRALGFKLGVFFNPEDSLEIPLEHFQYFKEFMFMSVTPGRAGSDFNQKGLDNLKAFKQKYDKFLLDTTLSVDGGFNELTFKSFFNSPAEVIYTNSFLKSNGVKEALNKLSILANQYKPEE